MRHTFLTLPIAALIMTIPALAGQDEPHPPHETQVMKPKAAEPQILTLTTEPQRPAPDAADLKAAGTQAAMPATPKAADVEIPEAEMKTAKADGQVDEIVPAADGPAPVNGRIIHQSESGKVCIGGVMCQKFCEADGQDCKPTESLTIRLDGPAEISTIQLSAHDNIGKTKRSRLVVKVNGMQIADTLVYKLGSTLSIDVGQTGELITIESAHQYNGFLRGGEEAVIWDVYVFGKDQS